MHDCGHAALFDSARTNKIFGYLLGVITGMPQFVWSKHHAYHHTTNGNWEKYKGPMNIITAKEYLALPEKKQKRYWMARHPSLLFIGGFYYVLFNPRFTWIVGSIKVFFNIFKSLIPGSSLKTKEVLTKWEAQYWKTPKEYRHMTYNNLALLSLWVLMANWLGAGSFFSFYALTLAISGGLGILFFTMQHNFEHSYATNTLQVDYYQAAIEGTSYLKLPSWLNWCTADIAYHHIHHLSTSVPNYRLKACHNDLKEHFTKVRRINLKEIPKSSKYLLWDTEKQALVSLAELS